MAGECDCQESCRLAEWSDLFTPATRELLVFTKNSKRYFDLDAVREPYGERSAKNAGYPTSYRSLQSGGYDERERTVTLHPAGAPPLDWWRIDPDQPPAIPERKGDPMTATFYVGDAIETMNKLPEKSVDLVLTSPPFLALRSYLPADHPDKALEGGSQSTPGEFIDWLIDVVEACDRVLAPHGSLCIELGDTYSGSGGAGGDYNPGGWRDGQMKWARTDDGGGHPISRVSGTPGAPGGTGWPLAKSLSLIPELFRFTLVYGFNPLTGRQTEPWRLRNVVRWVRPNPPVGALGDKFRPATSELMVFCKSAKRYFDLDAVREPHKPHTLKYDGQRGDGVKKGNPDRDDAGLIGYPNHPAGAPPLDWWNIPLLEGEEETRYGPGEKPKAHARTAKGVEAQPRVGKSAERGGNWASLPELHETAGAPPLDWWNIPPGGYEGAHYAVFPPELCVKPVKAMCPEKVCRTCGEPSRRIVGETEYVNSKTGKPVTTLHFSGERRQDGENHWNTEGQGDRAATRVAPTLGFSDCGHDDWRPGLVLDPFVGSGTTLMVATGHGRDAIGIDLDERNYELALERVGPFILTLGTTGEEDKDLSRPHLLADRFKWEQGNPATSQETSLIERHLFTLFAPPADDPEAT